MRSTSITIATRESPLALWQANWVKSHLHKLHPAIEVRLLGLKTTADKMLDVPLRTVGGKGLFVKELEEALQDGRADIAVHSMKDVPMQLPAGLIVPVICAREDVRDVFVANHYNEINELPTGALLGTSSLRRQSQIYALRPDLKIVNLRGNVNTRLLRLDQDEFSGIILAAAGLIRLGLKNRARSYLSIEQSLPACGQGVLGIECREQDEATQRLIAPLNDRASQLCITAERSMCKRLGGGCFVPIGAYAEKREETIFLQGLVARPNGTLVLRTAHCMPWQKVNELGILAAEDLLNQGAGGILTSLGDHHGTL